MGDLVRQRGERAGAARSGVLTSGAARWAPVAIWLAVLSSIVFLPEAMTRWMLPKDALFALAAVAASLALGRGRLPRWLLWCAGGGILLLVVGVAFSAAPWAAFWGRWPRYEGVVSLSAYLVAVWAGARLLGPAASVRRIRSFWAALSVASILLGVIGVLESFGIDPIPTPWERPGSLAGNATDQGILGVIFVALLALPAVQAWRERRAPVAGPGARGTWWAVLLGAGAVFALVTVVASASRAAFLGAVVVVVVLAVLQIVGLTIRKPKAERDARHRRRTLLGVLWAVGGLVLLVGVALAVPLTRNRLLGLSPLSMSTVSDRILIWQEAFGILAARPLVGVGPSGFVDAAPAFHTTAWYESVGPDTVLDSPHNLLLQAALAGGIPLALLLAVTGLLVLTTGCRRWAAEVRPSSAGAAVGATHPRALLLSGSVAALAATAAALMTSFTVPATAVLCCLLVGVVVARPPRVIAASTPAPGAGRRTAGAVARTAVLTVWAVFLLVTTTAEVPLQVGVSAAARGDVEGADAAFELAQNLRPWDADVPAIAAQHLAGASDRLLDDETAGEAAAAAERWSARALAIVPDSVPTLKARALAQRVQGDPVAELATLDRLAELVPLDPDVRFARDRLARETSLR